MIGTDLPVRTFVHLTAYCWQIFSVFLAHSVISKNWWSLSFNKSSFPRYCLHNKIIVYKMDDTVIFGTLQPISYKSLLKSMEQ
jgi:hypothetical protein